MRQVSVVLWAVSSLAACSSAGPSDEVDAGDSQPPYTAPAGFMVMEMGAGLHTMWRDSFSDETSFELQRREDGDFAKLADLPAESTEYMDVLNQSELESFTATEWNPSSRRTDVEAGVQTADA
jgi:hypothetical protein